MKNKNNRIIKKNKRKQNKKNERWVIYSKDIEATKITSDWYLWMHHTIDKIPVEKEKNKYIWQKNHKENKTGTKERCRHVSIHCEQILSKPNQ